MTVGSPDVGSTDPASGLAGNGGTHPSALAAPTAAEGVPAPATGGEGLRHEPALDGLRGLAVAAVVAFHLGRLDGGFLGVDLFFVLSGYLITSLLVVEHHRGGGIGLGRFWARRARRLLPALFVLLAGVSVLLLRLTAEADRARFRGDMLATFGYVANWHRMLADVGYWDMFSVPSPLDHTWSLAIEEQFYLVWPLVVLGVLGLGRRRSPGREGDPGAARRGDRRLFGVAVTGAVVSLALLAVTYDPLDTNRAYFGTDTRLGPTLLGAALAIWCVGRPRRAGRAPAALTAAAAALAVMAWMSVTVDGLGPAYYRGGLLVFAVATLVVIRAVTGGPASGLGRVLSLAPLTVLGTISYGVYLWHWPIIVFVTPDRAGVDGWALDAVRVALTLAVSGLSYVAIEQPIRRGAWPGRPIRVARAVAVPLTLACVLVATAGTPAAVGPAGGEVAAGAGGDGPKTNEFLLYPDEIPPGATRVLLVGDSGAGTLGPELVDVARAEGAVAASSAQILCSPINPEGQTRTADGRVDVRTPCHDNRHKVWAGLVDDFDPDVVIYYLANAGGVGEVLLDGEWVTDCDPAFDDYVEGALREDADLLGAKGAPVVFTTTPYVVLPALDSEARVDCRNDVYRAIAADRPGTDVVDLNAFVASQVAGGRRMQTDGIHLDGDNAVITAEWLLPRVLPFARSR